MTKIFYVISILIYVIIGAMYCSKFEISYQIVKVRPELVEVRSLTQDEVKALHRAYTIRSMISIAFTWASILIALFSFILLKYNLFTPVLLLKIVLVISLSAALVLIITNGINFIPTGPLT